MYKCFEPTSNSYFHPVQMRLTEEEKKAKTTLRLDPESMKLEGEGRKQGKRVEHQ